MDQTSSPLFQVGLNPYGIICTVGLAGTHPNPIGLSGFVELVVGYGGRSIEIDFRHLVALSDAEMSALVERLREHRITPVVSVGPPLDPVDTAVDQAVRVGANTVRVGLTTVLQGDRALRGDSWAADVAHVREVLKTAAPRAAAKGVRLALEDHQDFGSEELLAFAEESGENVGICFDTGNPMAVGEDVIGFATRVASRVFHVHLKDYNAQPTAEGYRLVRCAIGDGAVPFRDIEAVLRPYHESLTASLEPGALEARHIRLLTPGWWRHYPRREATELVSCLLTTKTHALDPDAEWRTPWELGQTPEEISSYEMNMMNKSVENMRGLGWL